MGGKTKVKQAEIEFKAQKILKSLTDGSLKHKKPEPLPELSSYFSDYRIFAIRDPDTFVFRGKSHNRAKQFIQLIRHTFEKYPAPRILEQCWESFLTKDKHISSEHRKYVEWYICVATGGSLHKEYTKEFFTKKETHIFLNAPFQLRVNQGIYYSIAKAADADVNLSFMIARSKISEKDYKNEFWRNCARFFATHHPGSLNTLNDLIDYISYRYQENRNFSLFGVGHTIQSLIKQMHQWHADLRRIKVIGDSKWEGHPIENQTIIIKINDSEIHWNFTQIKTAKDLAAEGNAMRHCVYGYRASCASGAISIWSLTSNDGFNEKKRRITIELRNSGEIAQARGLANRMPKPDEKNIIAKWASRNSLTYLGRY